MAPHITVSTAEINGQPAHTVRVATGSEVAIKAFCNSFAEALQIARIESARLGVDLPPERQQTAESV